MCSIKKAVLKDLVHRKKPVLEPLFNKVGGLKAQNVIKRDANTVFFCKYCKIFKYTNFTELLLLDIRKRLFSRRVLEVLR